MSIIQSLFRSCQLAVCTLTSLQSLTKKKKSTQMYPLIHDCKYSWKEAGNSNSKYTVLFLIFSVTTNIYSLEGCGYADMHFFWARQRRSDTCTTPPPFFYLGPPPMFSLHYQIDTCNFSKTHVWEKERCRLWQKAAAQQPAKIVQAPTQLLAHPKPKYALNSGRMVIFYT